MSTQTIPGFTRLTDSISLYRSPETTTPTLSGPDLLVLCSWMGAAPKHISKYTSTYKSLLPKTTILVLQCSLAAISYSAKKQNLLLAPARDIILNTEGKIVLHAFSNGGGTIASHLAIQLKKESEAGRGEWMSFDRVIFDCMPSIPTVSGAVDAIAFSLPSNPILRFLGRLLLRTIIFTYLLLFVKLLRQEDGVHWIRRILNDQRIFRRQAERLYVYSAEDALVQDWAVAEHAEDARGKGYKVREERFESGKHCALGVGGTGGRYWGVVGEFLRA